ncbi:DoxX family protein [Candidatus Uhrbacteria bacterium]|nr:DoxX family protein [Candidatus Uhrbacteria bacterium]
MPYFDLSIYGSEWALLIMRIALAAVFLTHGLSKRGMWKAAPSDSMPPSQLWLMRILSVIEPIAGIGVLFGIFTALSAYAIAIVMIGAMYYKIAVWKKKFSETGGWEFDLVLFAAALIIAAFGPGVFSLAMY